MKKIFNDQIDALIYNYFTQSVEEEKIADLINSNQFCYSDLEERYLWLKNMNIDPNIIHLDENHKSIYEIFDKCNEMFNANNIEYYYTSGILSYLLINKNLQRYHHDLDIFVNMKDLEKLEQVCGDYGFIFKRQLGDRGDGTNRIMLKMYYENAEDIPITVFMYVRHFDNTIVQNDYYLDDNKPYVERIYNSPTVVNLSFSNEPKYHNDIKYFAITLEALYISKMGNRPKDIYDCTQFEKYLDLDKLKKLENELTKNKANDVLDANNDQYYDFIFSEFMSMQKVLTNGRL